MMKYVVYLFYFFILLKGRTLEGISCIFLKSLSLLVQRFKK